MKVLNAIAMILVIIGGLNWGLVGFFEYDLVSSLFGAGSMVTRVIFGIVGVAALYMVFATPMMMKKQSS